MSHHTLQFGADAPLQFDTPATTAAAPAAICAQCSEPIRSVYYAVNANVVCSRCRGKLEGMLSSTGGMRRFRRAMGFGLVAAIAGAVFYYGFREITGIDFGLVAVLVGFMVGKAVFAGADRRGGRRYQVLAVVLTYFAIASTYLPTVFKEAKEQRAAVSDSVKAATKRGEAYVTTDGVIVTDSLAEAAGGSTAEAAATPAAATSTPATGKAKGQRLGFGKIMLAFFGMILFTAALPIIVGFSSIISVVILVFGLMQAWRMNRAVAVSVSGPYRIAGQPSGMEAA